MICLSLSYEKASAAVRGRFAFSTQTRRRLLAQLISPGSGCEVVLLCTCNRTEVYFTGLSVTRVTAVLADAAGFSLDEVHTFFSERTGSDAYAHLFSVASGLCSMVLGEDEILGQVKEAYREACEAGTAGRTLHAAFQAALTCGKRVRTETALSRTPISIATLAAHEAVRAGKKILIIGATGRIGGAVLKHLYSHAEAEMTVTRRINGAEPVVREGCVRLIDYAARYEVLPEMDCVVSATTSPHATLTEQGFAAQPRTKPLLVIDLSVPFDTEPALAAHPGITRLTLDDFKLLAQKQNAIRFTEAQAAKRLVSAFLENFGIIHL